MSALYNKSPKISKPAKGATAEVEAYRQKELQQDDADPTGSRKILAQSPKKRTPKSVEIEGQSPRVTQEETKAFADAHARIKQLNTSNDLENGDF
jgi:hypothetical protein